jgi:hypothetical protein
VLIFRAGAASKNRLKTKNPKKEEYIRRKKNGIPLAPVSQNPSKKFLLIPS